MTNVSKVFMPVEWGQKWFGEHQVFYRTTAFCHEMVLQKGASHSICRHHPDTPQLSSIFLYQFDVMTDGIPRWRRQQVLWTPQDTKSYDSSRWSYVCCWVPMSQRLLSIFTMAVWWYKNTITSSMVSFSSYCKRVQRSRANLCNISKYYRLGCNHRSLSDLTITVNP